MPLKHLTETILLIVFAVLNAVTGAIVWSLPSLPDGLLPWAVLFGATLFYPLLLYPLFRRDRADHALRALHFAPAAIAMLWIVLEGLRTRAPAMETVRFIVLWGFAFPAVAVGLLLAILFCHSVLRCREIRIPIITGILALVLLAGAGVETIGAKDRLQAMIWRRAPLAIKPSEDTEPPLSSSSARMMSSVSSKPGKLPSSGPGMASIALTMFGVYCAAMHRRGIGYSKYEIAK